MARILLLALALTALLTAPAQAATVRLLTFHVPDDDEFFDREDDSYSYSMLRFRAAPGERNRLTVRRASRGRIVFRDARARVKPGRGCRSVSRGSVTCRTGVDLHIIRVMLGGRADRLTVSSRIRATIDADGGPGADRLTAGGGHVEFGGGSGADRLTGGGRSDTLAGGSGRDRLLGGRGRDHLHGGSGRDRMLGGRGDDTLLPADGNHDTLHGGGGRDVASYVDWKTGVVLTPQGGGAGKERDAFTAIENLAGGKGDDVLTGDDAANRLRGRGGHDRIDGRGGNDVVDVRDASTIEGSVDVTCGEGADVVSAYTGNDRVLMRGDCEALDYASADLRFDPRPSAPSGRTVQLSLPCAGPGDTDVSRAVTMRTPAAGRPWYATEPFDAEVATGVLTQGTTGQSCTTTVELTDAGAELLQTRGELPVVVRVGARFFTPLALVLRAT